MGDTGNKDIKSTFKVLIADEEHITSRQTVEFLRSKGFEVEHINHGKKLQFTVETFQPTFILCDLNLIDFNALKLLDWVKSSEFKGPIPKIFVSSKQTVVKNIKECLARGAVSYVVKPCTPEDFLGRLIFQIQNSRAEEVTTKIQAEPLDSYFPLVEMALMECLSGRDTHEIFYHLVNLIGTTLKAIRCSIIRVSENMQQGMVMCSSDNETLRSLKIDINRYPEVLHVIQTQKSVVIEDLESDPQLKEIQKMVSSISFNSLIVVPVSRDTGPYGVLSIRMEKGVKFSARDIKFVELVGRIASLYLSSKSVLPHEWANHLRTVPKVQVIETSTQTEEVAAVPTDKPASAA